MPDQSTPRALAAAAARRGRRALRRWLGRQPQPVAAPAPAPVVSVIVPIYNVEKYLDECLWSLRRQQFGDLQIVVVDDGSPDGSAAIAARHAAEDSRIEIVSQPNAGLGAARNTGVRHARGDYLTFVDSDDVLPPAAIQRLVRSAEKSGSDMACGAIIRFNSTRRWRPDWFDLHSVPRQGISIEDSPELLRNNYTCDKLFRTTFWREQDLWFREGVAYEDQPLVTQLFVRAAKIDVLSSVVYEWRAREDASSISQQTHSLKDVRDRVSAWDETHRALTEEHAPKSVYDAWMLTLCDVHFHWYLNNKSISDEDYWTEVHDAVNRLLPNATPEVLAAVSPQRRVALELVRRGLHSDLVEFQRSGAYQLGRSPARLTDDGLVFSFAASTGDKDELPESVRTMAFDKVPLKIRLDRASWDDQHRLHVGGWAFFRYADLTHQDSTITVSLTHDRTGRSCETVAGRDHEHTLQQPENDVWADYLDGAFSATLDASELLDDLEPSDTWSFHVTVRTGPLERRATVTEVHQRGAARHVAPLRTPIGAICCSDMGNAAEFGFSYVRDQWLLEEVELSGDTLAGRMATEAVPSYVEFARQRSTQRVRVKTAPGPEGSGRFTVDVPDELREAPADGTDLERWTLRAGVDGAKSSPVSVDPANLPKTAVRTESAVLAMHFTMRGHAVVESGPARVGIESADLSDDSLVLGGRVPAGGPARLRAWLWAQKSQSIPQETTTDADGSFSLTIPLRQDVGRFGTSVLPSTDYVLRIDIVEDDRTTATLTETTPALTTSLPTTHDGRIIAGSVTRGAGRTLHLQLSTPVGAARGVHRRSQFESRPRSEGATLAGALFETNFGEYAGDSAAAVHEELRRRGADIELYWSVKDHSVVVPDGGRAVVRNSPEYFDLLQSAKYLVCNMYQPTYHHKPDGQVIVQTFHGYPFKRMGHPHWESLRVSRDRIESYDRRASEWNYLVSPAPYATPLLTRDFAYHGDVLEIGYPRNDVLLSAEARPIRDEVRRQLGIAPGVTAVLYAPTFRDYLSANDHSAVMVDFLDPVALSRALGPDYVILVRGHAFNARKRSRPEPTDAVIDVTDYPEPSDLYLASDAAIVDYSSLRFDYAVTGKPMIFLVPDLDRYQETRGWVVDFAKTAPGPHVATTDEVAELLLDLPAVVDEFASDYDRFRQEFLALEDGGAAARFVDAVFVPRGDAPGV